MLWITPKDKEEEKELNKWYDKTYESHYEMDDFMVYIEPVKNNVVVALVSLDEQSEATVCDNCSDPQGMYLGMTCPKCKRCFRDVKQTGN